MKQLLKRLLDRPGGHHVLGLMASVYSLIRPHTYIFWIYYEDGVWVHKRRGGVIVDRTINYKDSLLEPRDYAELHQFVYKPEHGDVICYVGAGTGLGVAYFSKAVGPRGKVIAIEAHPQTFLALSKFSRYNKLDNVLLANVAIGATESECLIDDNERHFLVAPSWVPRPGERSPVFHWTCCSRNSR